MINYLLKGKISHRDFLLIYQAVQFRPYRTFSSESATRKGDSFSLNISILKYKDAYSVGETWHCWFKFPSTGHRRQTCARGWPGVVPVGCPGWDVEASSWSVYYIVVVCLDLPTKQKNEQLTFSWVLYFTLFVSYSLFSVLFSNESFHFRLSILQIQEIHWQLY